MLTGVSPLRRCVLRFLVFYYFLFSCPATATGALPAMDFSYGTSPKFVCTPIPPEADPSCYSPPTVPHGAGSSTHSDGNWRGMISDEAKATILHLRESLVRQKETILDQRETIRELTAKLTLCEGFGGHHGPGHHDSHHDEHHENHEGHHSSHHHGPSGYHSENHHSSHSTNRLDSHHRKNPFHSKQGSFSLEQTSKMLQTLKERLEGLQARNSSSSYSSSLKDLLERKISSLEEQLHAYYRDHLENSHHDDHHGSHIVGAHHSSHPLNNNRHDGLGYNHNQHTSTSRNNRHGSHYDRRHDYNHHYNRHQGRFHSHFDDHHDGHHDTHHEHGHHEDDHGDHHGDEDYHHDDQHRDQHETRQSSHQDSHHGNYHQPVTGEGYKKLETVLSHLHYSNHGGHQKQRSSSSFLLDFPMRTNYMYGRVKKKLLEEIFALTICLRMKTGTGPGMGTPFSYAVPGQSNELVLMEWSSEPLQLLVNNKAATLPVTLTDGKWHHMCVTWSTTEGVWEVFQDGEKKGSGQNLSAWHTIRPGGIFILGQEQDTMGGHFDVSQSFSGEMADLQFWSRVLTPKQIHSQASCAGQLLGDVFSWSEESIELLGGLRHFPFQPCN